MEGIDRLSDLPDGVLHHILSSLDTKCVVQTSVLSSRWRFVWKQVHVLNFRRSSFGSDLGFVRHVEQVLPSRLNCDVLKISTDFRIGGNMGVFGRIMEYAASHGVQQLYLLRVMDNEDYSVFSDAVALVCGCYQSLKLLELQRACLDKTAFEMLSGLVLLETLTLHSSNFEFGGMDEPHDPFGSFPKLESLQVLHGRSGEISDDDSSDDLMISGPQLLYLEIHQSSFDSVEIVAPKLRSFTYWSKVLPHLLPTDGSKWNLPSLNHATINLWGYEDISSYRFYNDEDIQMVLKQFVGLFHGLSTVESLSLHLDTLELLIQACDLAKHEPSPLKKLKSLSLMYSKGSFSVPYQVLRFFLEGSPNVDDKYVMIEKRPWAKKHEIVFCSSVPVIKLVELRKLQGAEELTCGGTMEGIDRLSDLPDGILHHILSSLDTKCVVQTSVLSSRWRLLWKQVPVLNFRRSSFESDLGFVRHVQQVLSSRSNCDVLQISTDFRILTHMGVFDKIMEYASFHGVQQLSLLRIMENEWYSVFSDAVYLVSGCYQSLKILELQQACLDKTAFEFLSDLELLETLTLHSSNFEFGGMDDPHDPFGDFPKLERLQILHCSAGHISANDSPKGLMISGPQLLYLEIHHSSFDSVEIFAPKLRSFTYWSDVLPHLLPTDGSKWNLPSLNHAAINLWRSKNIFLYGFFNDEEIQMLLKQFVGLFHGLCNVESLSLHMDTLELLTQACDLVKHQPSPLKKLKSLSLMYCKGSFSVPHQVLRFFLEGSPTVDDKYVMIEKRPPAKKHELVAGSSVPVIELEDLEIPESARSEFRRA